MILKGKKAQNTMISNIVLYDMCYLQGSAKCWNWSEVSHSMFDSASENHLKVVSDNFCDTNNENIVLSNEVSCFLVHYIRIQHLTTINTQTCYTDAILQYVCW